MTLRWWNDLWLNEGFASYVEYLGANEAEPDWNIVSVSTIFLLISDLHLDSFLSLILFYLAEQIMKTMHINCPHGVDWRGPLIVSVYNHVLSLHRKT